MQNIRHVDLQILCLQANRHKYTYIHAHTYVHSPGWLHKFLSPSARDQGFVILHELGFPSLLYTWQTICLPEEFPLISWTSLKSYISKQVHEKHPWFLSWNIILTRSPEFRPWLPHITIGIHQNNAISLFYFIKTLPYKYEVSKFSIWRDLVDKIIG